MATTPKPSRNQYLNQRVDLAKQLGRDINITIPKNPTKDQLTKLDDQINKILYPSGQYGDTRTAAQVQADAQAAAAGAAREEALRAQLSTQQSQQQQQRQSAFDFIRTQAQNLGIGESVADRIIDFVAQKGFSQEAINLAIQDTPEFKSRFAGIELYKQNFASDIAAGKKAVQPSPAEYVAYEKKVQDVLNRFGLSDLANQQTYAELIGNDVSAVEVTDRITDVYDRIQNADDVLKTQLRTFFPKYQDSDFARALLTGKTPDDMANQLKKRLTTAEISSEAVRAGLSVEAQRAEQLQAMGVSRIAARAGYSKIAEQQTGLSKLASIYQTDVAGIQQELEAEQFQGLASQRRKKLEQTEQAAFAGRAGTTQVSLSQQGTAGTF